MSLTLKMILKPEPKLNGTHAIQIRVTKGRKHARINTGEFTLKKHFDKRKGLLKPSAPDSNSVNLYLDHQIRMVRRYTREQEMKGVRVELHHIKRYLQGKDSPQVTFEFISWAKEFIEIEYPPTRSYSRYNQFRQITDHLKSFQTKIYSSDLTIPFVKRFKNHLHSEGLKDSTVAELIRRFKRLVRLAIESEVIENSSILSYNYAGSKVRVRKYLSEEELSIFRNAKCKNKSEEEAKDIFLWMYYLSGARIGDALTAKTESIIEEEGEYLINGQIRDKKYYWEYTPRKLRSRGNPPTLRTILPNDEAVKLYHKYNKGKKYLFPFLPDDLPDDHSITTHGAIQNSIKKINYNLRRIEKREGIQVSLTCHVARHTFIDIAEKKNNDFKAVSKAAGHMNVRTTEGYLSNTDQAKRDHVALTTFTV